MVLARSGDEGDEGRQGMAVDDGRGSRAARERALEELGNARDVVLRAYMGEQCCCCLAEGVVVVDSQLASLPVEPLIPIRQS